MSLTSSVLKGSLTLLLLRMFLRVTGLVSMLLLARILTPEDFGVVAIVSLVVFLFDILSESGTAEYIIQKPTLSDEDLHTAWSVNVLSKSAIFLVFILSVPFIALFFEDQALETPLYVISILLLVSGFQNPGMFVYQKELNFKPQFKMVVIDKMISLCVVIPCALILKNYWAMIIGLILSYTLKSALSFYFHPFRPRFSLKKLREQWQFSQWMIYKGIIGYTRAQFDNVIVSKSFGIVEVGGYNMMKNLSAMPAQDVITPATQPLLSSFSKVKNDTNRLMLQVNISLFAICLFIFPTAYFISIHYESITVFALGEKWLPYSELLRIMSILLFTFSFVSVFQHLLVALGKVKIIFYYDLLSVAMIVSVLFFVPYTSIEEFAWIRCILALLALVIFSIAIKLVVPLKLIRLSVIILPMCVGSYIAGVCSEYVSEIITNVYLRLLITTVAFYTCYFVSCLLMYAPFQKVHEIQFIKNLYHQENLRAVLGTGRAPRA